MLGSSSPTGLLPCFQRGEAVGTSELRAQGCLGSQERKLPDLTGLTVASASGTLIQGGAGGLDFRKVTQDTGRPRIPSQLPGGEHVHVSLQNLEHRRQQRAYGRSTQAGGHVSFRSSSSRLSGFPGCRTQGPCPSKTGLLSLLNLEGGPSRLDIGLKLKGQMEPAHSSCTH